MKRLLLLSAMTLVLSLQASQKIQVSAEHPGAQLILIGQGLAERYEALKQGSGMFGGTAFIKPDDAKKYQAWVKELQLIGVDLAMGNKALSSYSQKLNEFSKNLNDEGSKLVNESVVYKKKGSCPAK